MVTMATWAGIIAGIAAVWAASRQIGLSTWWLGPRAGDRSIVVSLIPFVPGVTMIIAAVARVRYVWAIGIVASLIVMAIGLGDLSRVARLGAVEIALGVAGCAVSLASWTGTVSTRARASGDR
jgi:hypothetical protein